MKKFNLALILALAMCFSNTALPVDESKSEPYFVSERKDLIKEIEHLDSKILEKRKELDTALRKAIEDWVALIDGEDPYIKNYVEFEYGTDDEGLLFVAKIIRKTKNPPHEYISESMAILTKNNIAAIRAELKILKNQQKRCLKLLF
ncbi:hypothetical protein KAW80_01115 [Candidatus Babeliales bacterium]|nr:hypothetical protein [Candidatus Babeliales bacterium]